MTSPRYQLWALQATTTILLLALRTARVHADAIVTGTVFCDQCKDGHHSLFDYPLSGAKVGIACGGGGMGAATGEAAYEEGSTNWFGGYAVRFRGSPDLSRCRARVVAGGGGACGDGAGPARELTLVIRMFGTAFYAVGPLLAEPLKPMSFCPNTNAPAVARPPPPLPPPPPPMMLPLLPPPPVTFFDASACSYDKWMMPEYKCYWRMVVPETKVALAFGPVAAGRYGADITLWDGLHGRGDLYRTLLREGTTALLNSYHSIRFPYPTLSVIDHMNRALLGSQQEALSIALRFKRANLGIASAQGSMISCNFTPCS